MSVERLVTLLTGAGLDVGADEVLDALWLAAKVPGLAFGFDPSLAVKSDVAPPRLRTGVDGAAGGHATRGSTPSTAGSPAAPGTGAVSGERPLFAQVSGDDEEDGIPAAPFRVPAGQALPGRLALMRALRPFARPWISQQLLEIDEERTVELSAETGGLGQAIVPVFKPGSERWFGVDIVMEDDVAVEIWEATLSAFQRLLEQSGAFRVVRLWRLSLGANPDEPVLIGTNAQQLSARRLVSDGTRRMIVFASHGASRNWANGRYAELIGTWQTRATLLLLHLLPRRRWGHGALGEPEGLAHAEAPGLVSADLRVIHDPWWIDEEGPLLVTVPVIPLDPKALADFAAMTMGASRRIEAYSLDTTVADWAEEETPPEKVDRVVQRLAQLRHGSGEAYSLAVALSPTTFTLPVARLMQDAVLGAAAQPSQLGEIFLTGLVAAQDDADGPIDRRSFAFVPEAAAQLAAALSENRAQKLSERFGRRLADHIAGVTFSGHGFAALTPDPDGRFQLPAWARPFVRVADALAPPSTSPPDTVAASTTPARPEGDPVRQNLLHDIRSAPLALVMAAFALHRLRDSVAESTRSGIVQSLDDTRWWARLRTESRIRGTLRDAIESRLRGTLTRKRVLWIDDEPGNNIKLADQLRSLGIEIDVQRSTREALRTLRTKYDLILSDWSRPPRMDAGLELTEAVRGAKQRAPVVVFAGKADPEREAQTLAGGGYAYSTDQIELFWLIGEALSQRPRTRTSVAQLQRNLLASGFYSGEGDGELNSATRDGLQAFQREFGLPVTSWPGAATHARIKKFASNFPQGPTRAQASRKSDEEVIGRSREQPSMAQDVNSIRIYRHGFGRCMLLRLIDVPRPHHVLINFGVNSGVPQARARLRAVLDDILRETDGMIDHAIVTRVSGSSISGFGEADRLYVRRLILGWWEDENDRLGAEIRGRGREFARNAGSEHLMRLVRRRSQEVRFVAPGTEPLKLGGGARLFMFGGEDEHLRLRRRAHQPELDCAIELPGGEVLLFVAADRILWSERLQQRWRAEGQTIRCEDLLRRATFCSTHMLRREAIDFEGMLRQFMPSLRVLNIPVDRDYASARGWSSPDVSGIERVLRSRGGGLIFNEFDQRTLPSSMVETGSYASDVRFSDKRQFS